MWCSLLPEIHLLLSNWGLRPSVVRKAIFTYKEMIVFYNSHQF